jgi:hypothetical protein
MWTNVKFWLFKIAAALVAVIQAYRQGRSDATARLKQDEAERRIKTMSTAKEIRDEVDKMDDDELVAAASKWVRKPRSK